MSKLSRVGWGSMAVLFLVTSITLSVLVILQLTNHGSNTIKCKQGGNVPNQQPLKASVKGTKLVDFNPPQKFESIGCTDFRVGTGTQAQASSTVTVSYVGALASDGTIFDDSFDAGKPLTIPLNQVIPGWTAGVAGMKVGGVRRLFIPAQLAYGPQSLTGIPANSDLVFDIQLLAVQ